MDNVPLSPLLTFPNAHFPCLILLLPLILDVEGMVLWIVVVEEILRLLYK